MLMGTVLAVKSGGVQTVEFADGSVYETAIRKLPVAVAEITADGIVGNDVGLKAHHGGADKALFLMSDVSFAALNALLSTDFGYQGTAVYGENVVLSGWHEDNVCIGDQYQIGGCIIEISQPRKPCERLSKNTERSETQRVVFQTGWTGWYARVLQGGTLAQGDTATRLACPYPELTVRHLNALVTGNSGLAGDALKTALEQALTCSPLAAAFKKTLASRLSKLARPIPPKEPTP